MENEAAVSRPMAKKRRKEKYLVIGTYLETRQSTYDHIAAPTPDEAERIVRRARERGDMWEPVATYDATELMEAAIELKNATITKIRKSWTLTKSML